MALITFVRATSPIASWSPTHNPDYGGGSVKIKRYHQPVDLSDGGDAYSYNYGESGERSVGWNLMPSADLELLIAFFDTIHGAANKFVFTDLDEEVHTAQLINADSLTWREVAPGFYAVQVELDLS
jgi:hypothetical protein